MTEQKIIEILQRVDKLQNEYTEQSLMMDNLVDEKKILEADLEGMKTNLTDKEKELQRRKEEADNFVKRLEKYKEINALYQEENKKLFMELTVYKSNAFLVQVVEQQERLEKLNQKRVSLSDKLTRLVNKDRLQNDAKLETQMREYEKYKVYLKQVGIEVKEKNFVEALEEYKKLCAQNDETKEVALAKESKVRTLSEHTSISLRKSLMETIKETKSSIDAYEKEIEELNNITFSNEREIHRRLLESIKTDTLRLAHLTKVARKDTA